MDISGFTLIDSIRKRPAMYIGSTTVRGLKGILEETFADIARCNTKETKIVIEFHKEDWITLIITSIDAFSFITTVTDLDKEFTKDVAYEDVRGGLPIIIALSEKAHIFIESPFTTLKLWARCGVYNLKKEMPKGNEEQVTINFKPDRTIFKALKLNYELINHWIRKYAFLNPSFYITSVDYRKEQKQVNTYYYPQGIVHEMDYKIGTQLYDVDSWLRLDLQTLIGPFSYQISFVYLDSNWIAQPHIISYANNDQLIYGGSLVNGILAGIQAAIKEIAKINNRNIILNSRHVKKNLFLIAVVKGTQLVFGGNMRTRLEMPEVRMEIKKYIYKSLIDHIGSDPILTAKLLNKFR